MAPFSVPVPVAPFGKALRALIIPLIFTCPLFTAAINVSMSLPTISELGPLFHAPCVLYHLKMKLAISPLSKRNWPNLLKPIFASSFNISGVMLYMPPSGFRGVPSVFVILVAIA